MTEKKVKIKDLCKQKYLNALEDDDDEISISFWATISSIANTSYNEGYEDGQHGDGKR